MNYRQLSFKKIAKSEFLNCYMAHEKVSEILEAAILVFLYDTCFTRLLWCFQLKLYGIIDSLSHIPPLHNIKYIRAGRAEGGGRGGDCTP